MNNGQNHTIIGVNGGDPTFVDWGDSHAGSLVTVLSDLGKKYALSGYAMAHGHGTHPILGMDIYPNPGYDFDEAKYNANIIKFIKDNPNLKTIIIAGFWSSNTRLVDVTGEHSKNQNNELLMQFISILFQ